MVRRAAGLSARLEKINWDFVERPTPSALQRIHPYPAKFIGDIPRSLIETISLPAGTVVFDPFCGSGATLVESQRLGYQAVGIDLNPIACLISRVKTRPLPRGIQKACADVILSSRFRAGTALADDAIPNVAHWFQPDVRGALASIVKAIRSQAPERTHDFLFAALSSIIVRVSNQESDTRYAAISKAVTGEDVFEEFEASCIRLDKALASRDYVLTSCRVIEEDTLKSGAENIGRNVGLVITSPPYPNAYEYWLYHKYRMWWLARVRSDRGARAGNRRPCSLFQEESPDRRDRGRALSRRPPGARCEPGFSNRFRRAYKPTERPRSPPPRRPATAR